MNICGKHHDEQERQCNRDESSVGQDQQAHRADDLQDPTERHEMVWPWKARWNHAYEVAARAGHKVRESGEEKHCRERIAQGVHRWSVAMQTDCEAHAADRERDDLNDERCHRRTIVEHLQRRSLYSDIEMASPSHTDSATRKQ